MIKLKDDAGDFSEFQTVSPYLIIVLGYFFSFCEGHNVPCKITNIKNKFKVSKSSTHPDGRAFDASVRGWTPEKIQKCVKWMDKEVGYLGALSASDMKARVVVYHDAGLGSHFHFQVTREL